MSTIGPRDYSSIATFSPSTTPVEVNEDGIASVTEDTELGGDVGAVITPENVEVNTDGIASEAPVSIAAISNALLLGYNGITITSVEGNSAQATETAVATATPAPPEDTEGVTAPTPAPPAEDPFQLRFLEFLKSDKYKKSEEIETILSNLIKEKVDADPEIQRLRAELDKFKTELDAASNAILIDDVEIKRLQGLVGTFTRGIASRENEIVDGMKSDDTIEQYILQLQEINGEFFQYRLEDGGFQSWHGLLSRLLR